MDVFADALNVTLRHCVLAGGSQLRIGGLSESTARPIAPRPRQHDERDV
ncbi:dispersed gene family protein 1 (DGF-1), putative, partial [Trypanosoma cruzi]